MSTNPPPAKGGSEGAPPPPVSYSYSPPPPPRDSSTSSSKVPAGEESYSAPPPRAPSSGYSVPPPRSAPPPAAAGRSSYPPPPPGPPPQTYSYSTPPPPSPSTSSSSSAHGSAALPTRPIVYQPPPPSSGPSVNPYSPTGVAPGSAPPPSSTASDDISALLEQKILPFDLAEATEAEPPSRQREFHLWHLIVTFSIFLFLIFFFIFASALRWICFSLMVISLVTYFIMSFRSTTAKYLNNICHGTSIFEVIESVRAGKPDILLSIDCYHYETRTRTVTDSQGHSRTETYTVRVNTYSESKEYEFDEWRDVSQTLPKDIYETPLTRLHCELLFYFSSHDSKSAFETACSLYEAYGHQFDSYVDLKTNFSVGGFKERLLALADPNKKPKLLSSGIYTAFVFLFLAWFYKVWLSFKALKMNYNYVKIIGK